MDFELVCVDKPWGKFTQYIHNQSATVKIITVGPGEKLSLQKHAQRDELWLPLDEGLVATVDGKGRRLWKDRDETLPVLIPRGAIHTIENIEGEPARFLEISLGHFDEDDIERFEDRYGRC